ncbi:BN159_2729 family protein [Streptomyces sp. NPDC002580]|uniref:BN159_2729 family protein n=1 Tax=Streptomyces sp. NPDC002580 TaxID=3364653 RepID=UPI00367AFA07
MTTMPRIPTAVETHLAEQLGAFAREFVAELEAQGRLVEVGGARVLERLRTQVETWQNCPEAYHAAVDTIVEDCGYPSEVAMRIATALNRKGLIPGGQDPEPASESAPGPAPEPAPGPEPASESDPENARDHDHARDHEPESEPESGLGSAREHESESGPGFHHDRDHEPGRGRAPASSPNRTGPQPVLEDPEPRHDRAPASSSLVPAARGAIVLHLADRGAGRPMAEHGAAPVPRRVDGQVPRVRPAAARTRAIGWGSSSARAVSVAAALQSDHLARLEAMQIGADGERVTVAIKATCLADWEYWLDAIGAARNVRTRTAGHAQVAAGTLDGVAVHLTAHGVPELLQEASDAAVDPFYLWGRIYDLGMGQIDRADRIWLTLGRRQDERGMPLLVLRGTDGPPYPLASIVMAHGPLTATPLPSGLPRDGTGGECA